MYYLGTKSGIPPKKGKRVKRSPEHQENHWFYKVLRVGAENVVFGSKRADFWSFSVLGPKCANWET